MLLKYHFFYRDNIDIIRYIYGDRVYSYVYHTDEKNWMRRLNNPFQSFNGDFFRIISSWIGKYDKKYVDGSPIAIEISPISVDNETTDMIEEANSIDQYIGIRY